jgi:hypothetical protein
MKIKVTVPQLAELRQFDNWKDTLQKYLIDATHDGLGDLEIYTQNYMYATFINPEAGTLETNFTQDVEETGNGVKGYLINDSPYAWRREQGFSGKTDSLGRFYPNDPGIAYMANTVLMKDDDMVLIYERAVSDALDELAYGIVSAHSPLENI